MSRRRRRRFRWVDPDRLRWSGGSRWTMYKPLGVSRERRVEGLIRQIIALGRLSTQHRATGNEFIGALGRLHGLFPIIGGWSEGRIGGADGRKRWSLARNPSGRRAAPTGRIPTPRPTTSPGPGPARWSAAPGDGESSPRRQDRRGTPAPPWERSGLAKSTGDRRGHPVGGPGAVIEPREVPVGVRSSAILWIRWRRAVSGGRFDCVGRRR